MRKKINKMSEWSAKTEFTPLEVGGSGLFVHTAQRDAVQDGKERQQSQHTSRGKNDYSGNSIMHCQVKCTKLCRVSPLASSKHPAFI